MHIFYLTGAVLFRNSVVRRENLFFAREIKYLHFYEHDQKKRDVGICKCRVWEDHLVLEFCLKQLPVFDQRIGMVKLWFRQTGQVMEKEMSIRRDLGDYQLVFHFPKDGHEQSCPMLYLWLGPAQVICDETDQRLLLKTDLCKLDGHIAVRDEEEKRLMPQTEGDNPADPDSDSKESSDIETNDTKDVYAAARQEVVRLPGLSQKGETYYLVEPEQLLQFGSSFARFSENSFLLHGYYNYRHIVVGPVSQEPSLPMRIGVPGNYYQREKIVAEMFGFLEFEAVKGSVGTGTFGYYYTPRMPVNWK